MQRSTPERFNVFDVLEVQRREYIHSNVLAWLLDPAGSHGMRREFLGAVCRVAGLPTPSDPVRVRREEVGPNSIIDIIVEMRDGVLIIENKVDAAEGERQTEREWADFAPRAAGRAFKAVLLAPQRSVPGDKRFVAWGYEEIWRLLGNLNPDARIGPFIEHYRQIVDRRLLGGHMSKFRGFNSETKFILENFDDVRVVREALQDAEANIRELVLGLPDEVKNRSWWSDEWRVEADGAEVNVWKSGWGGDEPVVSLGITKLVLDAVGGGDERAWSYIHLASALRGTAASDRIAAAAKMLGEYRATAKYPFWRHLSLDGKAGGDALREQVLAELDTLVETFTAVADKLVAASSRRVK